MLTSRQIVSSCFALALALVLLPPASGLWVCDLQSNEASACGEGEPSRSPQMSISKFPVSDPTEGARSQIGPLAPIHGSP